MPRALRVIRRQRPTRVQVAGDNPLALQLPLLMSGEQILRPVLDLTKGGLAFVAQAEDLLPIGSQLTNATLCLPSGPLTFSGRIVARAALPKAGLGKKGQVRCTVRFDGASDEDLSRMADAIMEADVPGVSDARNTTFQEIWDFLKESGFLYPEKAARLAPVLPEIQRTMTTLLGRPNRVLKTLVYRSPRGLQGHLSAARLYRHTWLVQHLATLKGGVGRLAAARALNLGVVEYLENAPDMTWIRVFFRPQNRWPARIFGRFTLQSFDPAACELRTFGYWVSPTLGPSPETPAGLEIREPLPAERAQIEAHFVAKGRSLALMAEDLGRDTQSLTELNQAYGGLGLFRSRKVLVAVARGRLRGFSLLEMSSLGLNFSELTNTFTVHLMEPDEKVAAALAASARREYHALGRPYCIGLSEGTETGYLERLGFTHTKVYAQATMHKALCRRFYEFVDRLHDRPLRRLSGS